MATGPGVSLQTGSPARELSISVQQAGNLTLGDRVKPEDVTGKIHGLVFFVFIILKRYEMLERRTRLTRANINNSSSSYLFNIIGYFFNSF